MKTVILASLTVIVALLPSAIHAIPAFPGAEGFGAETTTGGRGGRVIVVTTTATSGAGSFSAALKATGPRIIVFRVSGVIATSSNIELRGPQSNFTIAGQTSPGGITLRGAGESFWYNYQNPMENMIIRFVRFRSTSGAAHGLMMHGVSKLVIDHCDFSGGSDETFDLCSSHDFTVQWSTMTNSSAGQTYGIIFSYPPTNNISFHHNFSAHHVNRCAPHMHWKNTAPPNRGSIDHINNIFYNAGIIFLWDEGATGPLDFNLISNIFKAGPNTTATHGASFLCPVNLYAPDNQWVTKSGQWSLDPISTSGGSRFNFPAITTQTARQAFDTVLAKVGAWPRDAMNTRTVNEAKNGTGQFRKDNDPLITSGPEPPEDTDMDGMPDCWETANGLNPNNAADATQDKFGNGYNNIEEYFNDLASVLLGEPPRHPTCQSVIETYSKSGNLSWLSVSPNPCHASGPVTIALPFLRENEPGKLQVFDSRGCLVANIPVARINQWNPEPRFTSGVYFIRWLQGNRVRGLKKLIIL
jgi:pectate lyase